jgi:uncharacterized protein (TIGR03905 family)
VRYEFKPNGVCSHKMMVEVADGVIQSVLVYGGCDGNLKGVGSLLKGMSASEAISRLQGITCGRKKTSCPDQLAKALAEALQKAGEQEACPV